MTGSPLKALLFLTLPITIAGASILPHGTISSPSTARILQPQATGLPANVCTTLRPPSNPGLPFPETLRIFIHGRMRDDSTSTDPSSSATNGDNEGQERMRNDSLQYVECQMEPGRAPAGLVGIAWDSTPLLGFLHPDDEDVWEAAWFLALLMKNLKDCDPPFNGPIEIVGHSYGARVVLYALHHLKEMCPPSETGNPIPGIDRFRMVLLNGAIGPDHVKLAGPVIKTGKMPIKSFYLETDGTLSLFVGSGADFGRRPLSPKDLKELCGLDIDPNSPGLEPGLTCHWSNCDLLSILKKNNRPTGGTDSHGQAISIPDIAAAIQAWGRFKYRFGN